MPWGCLVFGDRSDPKNVELELSPLLVKRVQDGRATVRRRILRDLLGKVRAYAETIIGHLFEGLVTRNAGASSSVQAQVGVSPCMGCYPKISGGKEGSVPLSG